MYSNFFAYRSIAEVVAERASCTSFVVILLLYFDTFVLGMILVNSALRTSICKFNISVNFCFAASGWAKKKNNVLIVITPQYKTGSQWLRLNIPIIIIETKNFFLCVTGILSTDNVCNVWLRNDSTRRIDRQINLWHTYQIPAAAAW